MTPATNTFNAAVFPLRGRRLIEASAGTGKTYNIANLYLRLLLGDGCEAKDIDKILVVTFTRAATEELRGRIREKIELALQAFRGESCHDQFICHLYNKIADRSRAARQLNYALLRMDEACIFTIHGFALRVIQTFLFETGALANVVISEAGNARHEQVLADVWRQLQLTRDGRLQAYMQELGLSDRQAFASYFAQSYTPMAAHIDVAPVFTIKKNTRSLIELLPQLEQQVDADYQLTQTAAAALTAQWQALCQKTGVEELKVMLGDKGNSKIFEKLDALTMPTGKACERMMLIHDSEAQDDLAIFIRAFVQHDKHRVKREDLMKRTFRALLLQYLRSKMATIDPESMQLDEVVSLINQTLRAGGAKAKQLRVMITRSYPLCLVDEFQDTDPAQFEMFNRLYQGGTDTGFFMIGDPKQSIYQFRGADIFSYLAVRHEVTQQEQQSGETHIFSLDTNFRSKKNLVAVTNRLFAESAADQKRPPSFVFPGIDYVDVKSCESEHSMDKGSYTTGHSSLPSQPLVFVGNRVDADSDNKQNGDSLRWQYAMDTAQRIAALLDSETGGKVNGEPLRAGDIAVLVRTSREAHAVRNALLAQTPRIASVYQSQRDSVFRSSLIAEDIYHLLCAMDDPKDKQLLKAAMATLLYRGFSLDFADLDAINGGEDLVYRADAVFEKLINEFEAYRKYWQDYGVLAAINLFISRRQLMIKLAQLPDCDRVVTDLRHLGELLQSQYLECSSRQELIAWYARQLQDDSEMDEDQKRIRLESDDNLVKIVTIHVAKGLEYPVVFLPFFYLPWIANADNALPLYHPEPDYRARVDFALDGKILEKHLQKEMLAEDMRLLYVAITRAIFQCYIGVAAATHNRQAIFDKTVWAHLLGITDNRASWSLIQQALQDKFGKDDLARHVAYQCFSDVRLQQRSLAYRDHAVELMPYVAAPKLLPSRWLITSYSALAHARREPGLRQGGADELLLKPLELTSVANELVADESVWMNDIRYRLQGSSNTGDCLHGFLEQLALQPTLILDNGFADFDALLQHSLRKHDLEKPEGVSLAALTDEGRDKLYRERRQQLRSWLLAALQQPLAQLPCLQTLFLDKQVLPELQFDFALGSSGKPARILAGINTVLASLGVDGIHVPDYRGQWRDEIEGLMTGSIDLLFIHKRKVYVLDYKSNTLGKSPSGYDQVGMTQAIRDNRYDLQYLIYSVAAHRYMQQRLPERYAFDGDDDNNTGYSFGGVFYLFLRGMGLPGDSGYAQHGIWFHRPTAAQILALDHAFGALS